MFAVTPKSWCEHLDGHVKPLPPDGIDASKVCEVCQTAQEPWVCLTCYHVGLSLSPSLCLSFSLSPSVPSCQAACTIILYMHYLYEQVYCGRYVNQHMLEHQDSSGHKMVLSLADISVWCFACDSYIDNHVCVRKEGERRGGREKGRERKRDRRRERERQRERWQRDRERERWGKGGGAEGGGERSYNHHSHCTAVSTGATSSYKLRPSQ